MLECVAGIPGGWGAQATVDLYREILILTPAVTDRDHRPVFIGSNSKIPEPEAALLARASSR
jgi:aspartate/glutamate racemase